MPGSLSADFSRYVERNALRANMVPAAELWPWSSPGCHNRPDSPREIIADWPLRRPDNGRGWVNEPQNESELAALRHCVNRGTPFGAETWTEATVKRLGLEATTRPRGRPKKTN